MTDRAIEIALPGDLVMTLHRSCITIIINDEISSLMSIDLDLRFKTIAFVKLGAPEKCVFLSRAS